MPSLSLQRRFHTWENLAGGLEVTAKEEGVTGHEAQGMEQFSGGPMIEKDV